MDDGFPQSVVPAIQQELWGVKQHRGDRSKSTPHSAKEVDDLALFGLAFSGGGIRSATFNLGVLQTLEKLRLLPLVDYISTVSGGGYIGSWYLSCLRESLNDGGAREPALAHLRTFSRYLAPQAGFLSADTWTIAMVWLRNTLLLQTMLVSLFALLLLGPRFFEWGFLNIPQEETLVTALLLYGIAAIQIIHRLARMSEIDQPPVRGVEGRIRRWIASAAGFVAHRILRIPTEDAQGFLQMTVVAPLLMASACFASALWKPGAAASWELPLWAGALVGLSTVLAARFSLLYYLRKRPRWIPGVLLIGGTCGALFASLAYALEKWYASLPELVGLSPARWLAGLAGAPALLAALGVTVVLQIGLLGRAIDDSRREWWSRLGAFFAIYSIAALALGSAAVYAPWLLAAVTNAPWLKWISGSVTIGGVATVVSGLMAAHSPQTSNGGGQPGKEVLARTAPFVFITGLLILVSAGLDRVLAATGGYSGGSIWGVLDASISSAHLTNLWMAAGVLVFVLLLLAWRVDIDEASMNPFYRNRLVRCYMGAAREARRERHPNSFTNFDFADDFALADLRPDRTTYNGPVPIVNAALNFTGGADAALQERRATSFFFTPYQSGSNKASIETAKIGKFERGIRLGSCMATSGAAASPNMGYHTSAPVAFLMTFFNVRLGMWLRNPIFGEGKQLPRWGLWYLFKELFATADENDHYVYLSDGGHFENLGVYELIRRRCRYIIACDAEQDENLVLEGLGNLVRKARIDFNAEIARALRSRPHQLSQPRAEGLPDLSEGLVDRR